MWLFVGLVLAASLGAIAPHFWPKRPVLALALVVVVPPLLLLWRYVTFVAAQDWEDMGAMALSIVAVAWVIITGSAGAFSISRSRADSPHLKQGWVGRGPVRGRSRSLLRSLRRRGA